MPQAESRVDAMLSCGGVQRCACGSGREEGGRDEFREGWQSKLSLKGGLKNRTGTGYSRKSAFKKSFKKVHGIPVHRKMLQKLYSRRGGFTREGRPNNKLLGIVSLQQ